MFSILLVGCAKAAPVVTPLPVSTASENTRPVAVERAEPQAVPEKSQKLRALLLARHPEDLPDKAAMDLHGAPDALHWLATDDEMMIIRTRALTSLAQYDDPASTALCTGVFQEEDVHAKLKAAAIRCLAAADLMADATLRNQLLASVRDTDPRVGLASVEVLSSVPAAESGLKAAAEDPAVTAPVLAKLKESLSE